MIYDLVKSFGFAFAGVLYALEEEKNFRLQWLMALMASLFIYWAQFDRSAQMLLLTIIFLILSLELINSAIEKVCDSTGLENNIFKKKAKDFAAGGVLLLALLSLLVVLTVVFDFAEPLIMKVAKNILLPIFWLLIFMGNVPLCLINRLSPYALMLCIPNLVLHVLFVLVAEGSALFLALSIVFHVSLILASAKRAYYPAIHD